MKKKYNTREEKQRDKEEKKMIFDLEKFRTEMGHVGIPVTTGVLKPLEISRNFLFPSDIEEIIHRCYPTGTISFSTCQKIEDLLQESGYTLLRGTMPTYEMEMCLRKVPIDSDSDFVHHMEYVTTKSILFHQEFSIPMQYWFLEYIRQKVIYYNFEPDQESDTQVSLLWEKFIRKAKGEKSYKSPYAGQLDGKIYDKEYNTVYRKTFFFHDFWEAYFLCASMNKIIRNIQDEVWRSEVLTIGDVMEEDKRYEGEIFNTFSYFSSESKHILTDLKKCVIEPFLTRKIAG